jgi:hypothetical protein
MSHQIAYGQSVGGQGHTLAGAGQRSDGPRRGLPGFAGLRRDSVAESIGR